MASKTPPETVTPSTRTITRQVLQAYHPQVWRLLDYLKDLRDSAQRGGTGDVVQTDFESSLLREDDSPEYQNLLTTSFITPEHEIPQNRSGGRAIGFSAASISMSEVIDLAQARIFTRTKNKPSNVITSGYRSAEFRGERVKRGGSRSGITNHFVNTIITALHAPEWKLLLKRVGESVLLHLLSETSIYVSLPNDCLCQVAGTPLIHVPTMNLDLNMNHASSEAEVRRPSKRGPSDDLAERPVKRRKTEKGSATAAALSKTPTPSSANLSQPTKKRSASDICFARVSMFYARPDKQSRTRNVLVGLPSNHVLNRMATPKWREGKNLSPDASLLPGSKDDDLISRHLLKYIFPLQYKMENVFYSESGYRDRFGRRRFGDRESEITTKGRCNTPTRLKRTLFLASKLFRNHLRCGYKPLLDKSCPSKVGFTPNTPIDSSVILEMISEQSIDLEAQLATQAPAHSSTPSMDNISAQGLSLARAHAKLKPKFAEFTCSHSEVFLFARLITKEVIPRAFWGSDHNFSIIMKNVKLLISSRRFESVSLHSVLQGFKTDDSSWLLPVGASTARCSSPAESLKRRELLEEFVFWYFEWFLIPLLKTTFYITDSSAFRNKVLYFRQDDWDMLCKPLLDRLANTHFERITQHEAEELLRERKLGFSFVRLLPKDTGVRPIVNLRRKKTQAGGAFEQTQSINQILQSAFQILSYEKETQDDRLGASVFGPDETFLKLKQFKRTVSKPNGKLPKLYFVKVDVQACFDTIEQDKLLEIVKDIISRDTYMIQRYGVIMPSKGKVTRRYERKALPDDQHPHFLTVAGRLASLMRHSIFVDQVVYPFAYREDIIELLEEHITTNIVKINNDYYRQSIGIPQGSILSSILCSFFYGDLERTSLKFMADNPNSVLLRLIDDYLYVTTSLGDAQTFLAVMNKGHPEYGCFISREKTLTNFDNLELDSSNIRLSGVLPPGCKEFSWCGLLINTEDLSVSVDYGRFHEDYLKDSLTVQRDKNLGSAFVQKMLQTARHRSHIIFTDALLNAPNVVYTNIHQSFLMTAMKMHTYLKSSGLSILAHSRSNKRRLLRDDPTTAAGEGKAEADARKSRGTFLLNTIQQCIDYTYASIVNKSKGWVAHEGGAVIRLRRDDVKWLGLHAFHSVLSLKRTTYGRAGVLPGLEHDLKRRKHKGQKHRLSKLANKSLKLMLENIKF